MNQSELVLIEEVNLFEENKTAEIKETGFKCQICFDENLEAENMFICNSCEFTICASCEPTCANDENCKNCRRVINGYSKVEKDQKPPAGLPTEQTTCSVSFRDNNDKVIALPTIYNISAKINSLKIYQAIRMYFYSVMGFIFFSLAMGSKVVCVFPMVICSEFRMSRGDSMVLASRVRPAASRCGPCDIDIIQSYSITSQQIEFIPSRYHTVRVR